MASEFVRRMAEQSRQRVDRQYSDSSYGGSRFTYRPAEVYGRSPMARLAETMVSSAKMQDVETSKRRERARQRYAERTGYTPLEQLAAGITRDARGFSASAQGSPDYRTRGLSGGGSSSAQGKTDYRTRSLGQDSPASSFFRERTQALRTDSQLEQLARQMQEQAAREAVGDLPQFSTDLEQLEDVAAYLASRPRKATFKDLTLGSFSRGYENSILGQETYKYMTGKANKRDEYLARMDSDRYRFETDNPLLGAVSGTAEMLGQQYRQFTDPRSVALAGTAAGMAAIAGSAGPQALVPEEIITVPGAFAAGMKSGSALSNMEIEAGMAYNEMIGNGIPHNVASLVAQGVGGVNGALEGLQLDELFKAFGAVGGKSASTGIAKAILKELGRRGIDVGNETLQEVLQEGTTITGAQLASKLDNGEWAYSADEVRDRLKDTAVSSALTFGLMNVPAGVSNSYSLAQQNRQAQTAPMQQNRASQAANVQDQVRQPQPSTVQAVQEPSPALSAYEQRLGENGRKNLQWLRERVGENVPDLEQQHDYYYNLGRDGLNEAQLKRYPSETPVSEMEAKGAFLAGRNDGIAEASETVQKLRDGRAVSDAAIDRSLAFQESRRVIEEQVGKLPEGGLQARTSVREWFRENVQMNENARYSQNQAEAVNTRAENNGDMLGSIDKISNTRQDTVSLAGPQTRSYIETEDAAKTQQTGTIVPGLAETEVSQKMSAEDREFHDTLLRAVGLSGRIVSQSSDTVNAEKTGTAVTIFSNAEDAESGYRNTVKHEVTHRIKELGAAHYQAYEDFAVAQMAAQNGVSAESLVEGVREAYRSQVGQELTEAQAREELAGDFAMLLDVDTEAVRRFTEQSSQNRQSAKGILQTIRDIISRVREHFANRKLTKEQRSFMRQLQEGERLWSEALGEASRIANENTAQTDGEMRFSIKRAVDGSQYVNVDTDILANTPRKLWVRTVDAYLKESFPDGVRIGNNVIKINSQSRRELTYSEYTKWLRENDRTAYRDKLQAVGFVDEILQASTGYINEGLNHPRRDRIRDFARGTVQIRVGGRDYTASVIVGTQKSGEMLLYDIIGLEQNTDAPYSSANRGAVEDGASVDTSISDSDTDVNENLPTRFSLKHPVEQTKNLIAVHNLSEQKLREAWRLGGLPMPSIAVIKAAQGHSDYGPVSIVFGRDTIDPEANSANHIYGADAWTPTAPRVDYEVSREAKTALETRLKQLAGRTANGMFSRSSILSILGIDDTTQLDADGIAEKLAQNDAVRAAWLADKGETLIPAMKEKQWNAKVSNDTLRSIADRIGARQLESYISELNEKDNVSEVAERVKPLLLDVIAKNYEPHFFGPAKANVTEEKRQLRKRKYAENQLQSPFAVEAILRDAWRMHKDGGATMGEIDRLETKERLAAAAPEAAVREWIRPQLEGLLGEPGIYNGKEELTAKGNRRGFGQLHYAYTLENLVKVMGSQDARGVGTWGASAKTLQSVAAPEYRSIQAVKDDSGRLGKVDEAYYESVLEEMDGVMESVITKIRRANPAIAGSVHAVDGIAEIILESARGKKTVDAIVRTFRKNGYKINNAEAMQLQGLFKASAELPTGYFEAKPQRAVRFDEAVAVVLPDSMDGMRQTLEEGGVQVLTYEDGDEQARLDALNSLEDARFSLRGGSSAAVRLAQYREKYGTLPRGEQAVRDIAFPKRTTQDTRVRRFARTAAESASLTDEQAVAIGAAVAEGKFNYEPVGDRAARNYAEGMLARGEQAAADAWSRVVANSSQASKNDIALGEYLLREAAKQGDTERVVQLAAEIAAEGTRAGQVVQAMRLLKQLDGPGQLVSLDAMLKKMQADLDKGKSGVFLKVSDQLRQELAGAHGEEQVNAVMDKIYTELAGQIPSTWADKWNAWRYLSMLGNPRTHIRNVLGNAAFEPAIMVKNTVGAALEHVFLPRGERTKSLSGLLPGTGGEARKFAQADFQEMKDIITGGGKMNPSDIIRERQRVFKTRALEWVRKQNFNFLEAEDGVFLEHHYVRSMTQYLKANKVDVKTLNADSDDGARVLNRVREYAVKEAQKATYRDFSQTAQSISNFSRNASPMMRVLVEGVLPFKKTPINVLKRGVEYSPIGLANTVLRGTNRLRKGQISGSEFIDGLSAGLTGTGIAALGWLLASTGVLVGGGDDDKEQKFRDALGAQSWALRFGDTTYTIDWLAPSAMPLFVGAEVRRLYENGMELNGRSVWDATLTIAEPMTQMSMLDGLNSALGNAKVEKNKLAEILMGAVTDYISQAMPTLLGQAARTVDPVRRGFYDDKNSGMPTLAQKVVQTNQRKIPFLSRKSAAYLDIWGREQFSGSVAERALQNFISPGYLRNEKLSDMESELIRLYQATEKGLPSKADKSIQYGEEGDKKVKYLTADEYQVFAETRGAMMYSGLSEITASAYYKALDDTDKAKAVTNMMELSNAIAKTGVSDYALKGWYAKAVKAKDKCGISLSTYVLAYSAKTDAEGIQVEVKNKKDEDGNPVTKAISGSEGLRQMQSIYAIPGLNDKQRAYLFEDFGVGKKIQHYNKAKVNQELAKMEKQAAK